MSTRREYCFEEDVKILNYLKSNGLWDKVLGNTIWKEMERRKVSNYKPF